MLPKRANAGFRPEIDWPEFDWPELAGDRRRSTMDAPFLHPPRLGRLEALRALLRRRAHA
jgi:hypothetical protein